jgi:hypothetical protein
MKKRWTTNAQHRARVIEAIDAPVERRRLGGWPGGVLAAVDANTEAEAKIAEWLARLRNLHGVPFYTLVSDVRMLPQESIRMFRIDENWIDCLIDGAFSLGRSTTGDSDAKRERANIAHLRPHVRNRAATQRVRRIFGANTERANAEASTVESGFLMRSAVVAGWPTMETRGYDASGNELRIIRFDRPASDVLFCIFDGSVAKVSLSEPAETLHFGFVPGDPYTKNLKYVDAEGHAPGTLIDGASVNVPMRDAARRVVAIDALASSIHDALIASGGMPSSAEYTTAEFSLELIQGVQQVDFTIGDAS